MDIKVRMPQAWETELGFPKQLQAELKTPVLKEQTFADGESQRGFVIKPICSWGEAPHAKNVQRRKMVCLVHLSFHRGQNVLLVPRVGGRYAQDPLPAAALVAWGLGSPAAISWVA